MFVYALVRHARASAKRRWLDATAFPSRERPEPMRVTAQRTLRRYEVGGLPLIHALTKRMGLSALLAHSSPAMATTKCR